MPRKRKPPRLWLEIRPGRESVWVILDGGTKIYTGIVEGETKRAAEALAAYIGGGESALNACLAGAGPEAPKTGKAGASVAVVQVLDWYLDHSVPHHSRPEVARSEIKRLVRFWGEKLVYYVEDGEPATDIRASICQEYVDFRTSQAVPGKPMKTAARNELITLRAAIRFWHAEKPLKVLPKVTVPSPMPAREVCASVEEVAALLWAVRRRPEARHVARVILIGVYTGTRSGAILGLRWVRSPDTGYIDLSRGILYRKGASKAETKKRQPPIRIHRKLLPHLVRWRRADLAAGISSVIHYNGEPIKKLRRSWTGVRKEAALEQHFVLHGFRHTAATWLMQAGVDNWEAAGYLGMTVQQLESYAHHRPDFQQNAASAVAPKSRNLANDMRMKRLQKGGEVIPFRAKSG
jgi:integrase